MATGSQLGLARIALHAGETAAARGRLDHARRLAAGSGDRGSLAELAALDARAHELDGAAAGARP